MLLFLFSLKKNISLLPIINDDSMDIFRVLYDKKLIGYDEIINKALFIESCKKGQLRLAKLFKNIFCLDPSFDLDSGYYNAGVNGHLHIIKWLISIDKDIKCTDHIKYIFCRVCEKGYLDMAKFLNNRYEINVNTLDYYTLRWSSINGHFLVVKWLYEINNGNIHHVNLLDAFDNSCVYGYYDMAKWIRSQFNAYILDKLDKKISSIFLKTCTNGHINLANWLYDIYGDKLIDNVQWEKLFTYVCENGHLDILLWIIKIGRVFDKINIDNIISESFIGSCKGNNLRTAKWLHSMANIDAKTLAEAFVSALADPMKSLDLPKWLWEMDMFPRSGEVIERSFYRVCKYGYLEKAKWLNSLGYSLDIHFDEEYPFRILCENGDLEYAQWLYNLGSSSNSPIEITAKNNSAFIKACQNNFIDIAKWLSGLYNEYLVVVKDDRVQYYRINNEIFRAQQCLKDDRYNEAIHILKIKSIEINNNESMCIICHDEIKNYILLKCSHTYCLYCLLAWFITIEINKNFKCAYCKNIFNWSDCTAINNKQ